MTEESSSVSIPPTVPHLETIVTISATVFPLIFFGFDVLLLLATFKNRRDTGYPLGYISAMCITGIITTLSMSLHYLVLLIFDDDQYGEYLEKVGRETTLVGTFGYLTALFISVLMTINRVVVVLNPFHNKGFSHANVLCYSLIIAAIVFLSLLIPYFSPCAVTFYPALYSFISGCAPNRHPITQFQNTHVIILPFSCMFVNLGLILHLRFVRKGSYLRFKNLFGERAPSQPSVTLSLSKSQARRDFIMMRQTVSVAVYLSVYEFGAFLLRTFPDAYMSLPPYAKSIYFYIRLESVPIMNFFIYYVQTGSTRRMFKRYLGIKESGNSGPLATLATTNPRNGQVMQSVNRGIANNHRIATTTPVVS